ncbi:hypothetical protein [Delftia tsuruhatensis]|uniref:hypothetical protein n=1 Tax=Delftia tsuruhatensis TaxID=180282 RepID=UPI0031E3CF86
MNAHIETNFKRGFFLTEEALIKLDDIIRKRLVTAHPLAKLQFKVFRIDGVLVEFDNPSAVAAEENSNRNAITRVEILTAGAGYKLSLKFDPKDNTDLAIESNDRDLAYLLASDIKDYINSEVLKFRSFSFDSVMNSRNIFPFAMLPLLFITISGIKESPKAETIAELIASSDVNAKLNLLIDLRITQDTGLVKWYIFAMIAVFVVLFFLGSLLDKMFPRNVFYWGKLAQTYDRRVNLREKIVWGIVIAFVIGIASTVVVDYFKRP